NMANIAHTEDSRSHCFAGLAIFGGATVRVASRVIATTGTLIRKTEPHQKNSSSRPPSTGPAAAPTTATDIHTAMARFRSRALVNVMRTRARLAGIMVAAPTPSRPRAAMRNQAVGENAATREPR